MPRDPAKYRKVPFRPHRESHERGNTMGLGWRYVRSYLWTRRGLLITAMVLFLASVNTGYVLTFTTRHMVNDILQIQPGTASPTDTGPLHRQAPVSLDRAIHASPGADPAAGPVSLQQAMDRHVGYRRGTNREIWLLCGMLVTGIVILNICGRISDRLQWSLSLGSCAAMRRDLHRKVLSLDYLSIKHHTPGRLMSNILSDVSSMQNFFVSSIVHLIGEAAMIACGIGLILWLDWRLALVAIFLLPLHAWLYHAMNQPMKDANRELRHTNSCLWQYSTQRLNGIKTIMAYTQEKREYWYFHRLGSAYLRDALLKMRYVAYVNSNAQFISGLATAMVYVVGTWFVMHHGMSVGDMIMFYGVVAHLFAHVLVLTQLNDRFSQISVVLNRLYALLDMPVLVQDRPDSRPLPESVRGEIRFDHVSYSYPEAERPALDDVSITVAPGEWLCIMGASGAGKSTFVSLLTRLADPSAGQITIDGHPLETVEIASLRRNMVLVPQEPQIFSGTIADNITYGRTDEFLPRQIMDAAIAADLHDTIMDLPGKYETLLGEKGVSLSGGQRQRLSIARAMITDPRILILDDCTSALDAATERRIQDTLNHSLAGRTAIVVSQRVSMAQRCDRILVLHDGRVSELGSHEELMAANRFYAQLHRRQTMVEDDLDPPDQLPELSAPPILP